MTAYTTDFAIRAAYDFYLWLIRHNCLVVMVEQPEKVYYFRSVGDMYRNAQPKLLEDWYEFLLTDGAYLAEDIPASKRLYKLILELTAVVANQTSNDTEKKLYEQASSELEKLGWKFMEKIYE